MNDLALGIGFLLLIISVLVLAHEFGHYAMARAFGMRVEDFSLFFGPIIARLGRRGDTLFHIRAIPFGGFVRIAGMEPEDVSGGVPALRALGEAARSGDSATLDRVLRRLGRDNLARINPEEVGSPIRQAVIEAIGPDMRLTPDGLVSLQKLRQADGLSESERKLLEIAINAELRSSDTGLFISKPLYQRALVVLAGPLASLLFGYLVFCVVGFTVGLPTRDSQVTNQVAEVIPGGEAYRVGIRVGDRIVAVNGKPTPTGKELVDTIHRLANKPTRITVQRGSQTFEALVKPRPRQFTDERGRKVTWGVIGIVANTELKRVGVVEAVKVGTITTYAFLAHLLDILTDHKQVRESVGGPIAMGRMATDVQRLGVGPLMLLAAQFSLSLFVLNLLPIPVLDGGQLLLLGVELVRRRKLSPREVYSAQAVGLGILMLMILAVTYNDILRLMRR